MIPIVPARRTCIAGIPLKMELAVAQATALLRTSLCAFALLVSACGSSVETSTPSTSIPTASLPYEPANAPSCVGDLQCGSPAQSCCASPVVEGGTFNRFNNPKWPATVSPFRLDTFEVTVARFRAFVDVYPSSRPKKGDAAHPKLPWSGWRNEWDELLPATKDELWEQLLTPMSQKPPPKVDPKQFFTWTNTPSTHENASINMVNWYIAFAFCAWDDARLPTEAEWSFAAVGGDEQRLHPWGDQPSSLAHAVLRSSEFDTPNAFVPVGSRPIGIGRFGQLDLGGNRYEWVLDAVDPTKPAIDREYDLPCLDCAIDETVIKEDRVVRDLSMFQSPTTEDFGPEYPPYFRANAFGIRCARDLP